MSLESREELSFMTQEKDAKFEEKLNCGLEIDMRNMADSPQCTQKSQNYDVYWVLLSKVQNVWAQNLRASYMLWQWKTIENLKKNLTQENLKSLHFNGLLLTKIYNVWA